MTGAAERKIGEHLAEAGLITAEQLARALLVRKEEPDLPLRKILVKLGFLDDDTLVRHLASRFGLAYVNLSSYMVDADVLPLVPRELCRKYGVVPLYSIEGVLTVAIGDPVNYLWVVENLEHETKRKIKVVLASEDEIRMALEKYYGDEEFDKAIGKIVPARRADDDAVAALQAAAPASMVVVEQTKEEIVSLGDADTRAGDAPVVNVVNNLLLRGLNRRASDIHIEPEEHETKIRFRIDGALYDILSLPRAFLAPAVSRIKIMSNLDISEKRLPQDGRFRVLIKGRQIDLRVGTMPTIFGERVVMRILDRAATPLDLGRCGLDADVLKPFQSCLSAANGIILVTGPTGSGKTTTLYAALSYLSKPDVNIMTAEDPVEYNLPGISQVQVHSKIGFDFARALEGFLRQDPDVILVGEIRNLETARIAFRASLTGHLVLSTLHTNDAAESVTRLVEMGSDAYVVGSALRAVLAQRLARRICGHCRKPDRLPSEVAARYGLAPESLFRGRGCEDCSDTGFHGRTAVTELLVVDEELREAVVSGRRANAIRDLARGKGMRTLRESALRKVADGVTSLDEALSVIGEAAS